MLRISIKHIQVLTDAIIPVIGYFLWDWSLFFILLYYLLDLFVSEVFMYIKSRAIYLKRGGNAKDVFKNIFLSLLLLFSALLLLRLFIKNLYPNIIFQTEIVAFWRYKDLGIQQGYLLIPLVFFIGYQRYKKDFLGLRTDEKLTIPHLWKQHLKQLILLLTVIGIVSGLSYFIVFPDWVYLTLLLISTSIYQLRLTHF
jgi:hypothetical protein